MSLRPSHMHLIFQDGTTKNNGVAALRVGNEGPTIRHDACRSYKQDCKKSNLATCPLPAFACAALALLFRIARPPIRMKKETCGHCANILRKLGVEGTASGQVYKRDCVRRWRLFLETRIPGEIYACFRGMKPPKPVQGAADQLTAVPTIFQSWRHSAPAVPRTPRQW